MFRAQLKAARLGLFGSIRLSFRAVIFGADIGRPCLDIAGALGFGMVIGWASSFVGWSYGALAYRVAAIASVALSLISFGSMPIAFGLVGAALGLSIHEAMLGSIRRRVR